MCPIDSGTRIQIDDGHEMIVDNDDVALISKHRWGLLRSGSKVYARTTVNSKETLLAHRLILGINNGDQAFVDHINGNSLDNRKSNLRPVSPTQNTWNRKREPSRTGFIGVLKQPSGSFMAKVSHDGISLYLGMFETDIEAAYAVNQKLDELRGGFGHRNEIDHEELRRIWQARADMYLKMISRLPIKKD